MENNKIKLQHSRNEKYELELREKEFIKLVLEKYVSDNYWGIITDDDRDKRQKPISPKTHEIPFTTRLNIQVVEHIIRNFTLEELYIIFCENQICYLFCDGIIRESKAEAIKTIEGDSDFTEKEKHRLKKKVWDMPKVMFGLIHGVVQSSYMFWDNEYETYRYPDLSIGIDKCMELIEVEIY